MEDTDNQDNETEAMNSSERTKVGFPGERKGEHKFPKKLLLIIILLLIVAGVLFWWFKYGKEGDSITLNGPTVTPSLIQEEIPVPTEILEEVNRSDISIRILNGSGISGAAATLSKKLEGLGFTDIETGNADNSDYKETEVSFAANVPDSVRSEVRGLLEINYEDVVLERSEPVKSDIEITIGYPKGHTPTPSQKPKSTLTPTPSTKPTGNVTPSVTTTSTPTPTP